MISLKIRDSVDMENNTYLELDEVKVEGDTTLSMNLVFNDDDDPLVWGYIKICEEDAEAIIKYLTEQFEL